MNQQQSARTVRDRIARLRARLARAKADSPDDPIIGILAGLLDLLEDEL